MLRGLNWGHRRAAGPMDAVAALARERIGVDLVWEQQTLAGFEHGLSAQVADRFDLVIFDHPFCGDIHRGNLLQPLEAHLPDLRDADFVGASLASYRYGGHLWGLPIDGCTQTAVYREDLLGSRLLPHDWASMLEIGRDLRREGKWLGLATLAPHGILLLLALCANLGKPLAQDPDSVPFDEATLAQAAELLCEAVALCHPGGRSMNAIELHDAMVGSDDIAYCPAAYAYLCYAEADQRRPLRFGPFPGPDASVRASALGGTGLGVTRSCRDTAAAVRLVQWLAQADAQVGLVMRHHGQPGRMEAWTGIAEDAAFGGAHLAVRATVEAAWTRPRFPGYLRWQQRAGEVVEQLLAGTLPARELEGRLSALWRECAPLAP